MDNRLVIMLMGLVVVGSVFGEEITPIVIKSDTDNENFTAARVLVYNSSDETVVDQTFTFGAEREWDVVYLDNYTDVNMGEVYNYSVYLMLAAGGGRWVHNDTRGYLGGGIPTLQQTVDVSPTLDSNIESTANVTFDRIDTDDISVENNLSFYNDTRTQWKIYSDEITGNLYFDEYLGLTTTAATTRMYYDSSASNWYFIVGT